MSRMSDDFFNRMQKQLDDAAEMHRHYRGAGIAFSVSMASLAGALIAWTVSLLDKHPLNFCLFSQLALLSLSILACLGLQFCNYQGYRLEAQAFFNPDLRGKNNVWFDREDKMVYLASATFLPALVFCAISLSRAI